MSKERSKLTYFREQSAFQQIFLERSFFCHEREYVCQSVGQVSSIFQSSLSLHSPLFVSVLTKKGSTIYLKNDLMCASLQTK